MRTRTLLLFPVAAALTTAVPALASDPPSGTVSAASPNVAWTGVSNAYGPYLLHSATVREAGESAPCDPPACDSFELEVAQKDLLTLTADNAHTGGPGDDIVQMDVVRPGGGGTLFTRSEEDKPVVVKIRNAAEGVYRINVWVNQPPNVDGTFHASALLGDRQKAPAPAPGQPAPAPATLAETPAEAAILSLKTRRTSARKVRKALRLAVGTTKPVTEVRAALRKGKRVLGTAKLDSLDAGGTLTFKLGKALRKGAYTVAISAKDGERRVGLASTLKVTR